MADYRLAYPIVLENEGGFNKNLGDGAGMTYRGITEAYGGNWEGWQWIRNYIAQHGYPKEETIFPELESSVVDWYRANKWSLVKGDQLVNQDVANFTFDFVVNSGQARKQINKAINKAMGKVVVVEDNKISADSLYYLNGYAAQVYPFIIQQRKDYLSSLDSFDTFGTGWFNRIAKFPDSIMDALSGGDEQKKK